MTNDKFAEAVRPILHTLIEEQRGFYSVEEDSYYEAVSQLVKLHESEMEAAVENERGEWNPLVGRLIVENTQLKQENQRLKEVLEDILLKNGPLTIDANGPLAKAYRTIKGEEV